MKKILLFLALFYSMTCGAQQTAKVLKAANGQTVGFLEFKPPDYGSQRHPLIIFLHGIGERGSNGTTGTDANTVLAVQANEPPKLAAAGISFQFTVNCQKYGFVMLAPQLSAVYGSWQNWYVDEMLKYAKANLQIDTTRIYLTGLSLGGGGVWRYASTSLANAAQFAAIAPVCGTCDWADLCNISKAGTPVWAFHAQDDNVVGVGCTNAAVAALAACGPALVAQVTIYPNGGHWIWSRAYDVTNSWHTPNLYEWLLTKQRPVNAAVITAPVNGLVANAGADQTVSGTAAALDASGSSGYAGEWAVSWRIVSQPAGSTWDIFPGYSKVGLKKTLQNLAKGRYVLELLVIDKAGNKATDQISITVQ